MSDDLPTGTVVADRYRIDGLIGEGGMGKVYSAEHVRIRKRVAIKVLRLEMSSTPEYVARFEREAVAAATISHPNVAAALDYGRLPNDCFYMVLEFVSGTDLRTILQEGPLSKPRALRIIRQTVAALVAAHAAGIVHRDLKPENIMVVDLEGARDTVKVLDFGIAKMDAVGAAGRSAEERGGEQALTKLGAVFGTPDYMSPEQALGQTVDARSDLYAVGVILRELVTGERLFKGGAVTLMRAHVLEAIPPLPAAVVQSFGARLEKVIERLLQKNPDDRYASAAELLAALEEPAADEAADPSPSATSVDASPSIGSRGSWVEPAEEADPPLPLERRRSWGVLVLALIVLGGAGVYFSGIGPQALERSLTEEPPPASAAPSTSADSSSGKAAPADSAVPAPTPKPSPAAPPHPPVPRPSAHPAVAPSHKPAKPPSSPAVR